MPQARTSRALTAAWWTRKRLDRALLALLLVVVVESAVYLVRFASYRLDLDVYRIGSHVLLHGGALYGTLPPTSSGAELPFTYPPIAAVLLVPLAVVPFAVANLILTAATIAATAATIWLVARRVVPDLRIRRVLAALGLAVALLGEPVRSTLTHGQVNSLLMLLVVADTLVATPRWPRGALVGLAAAIKLTPAVFVLYFLLRRDRRSIAVAALSFLVWTGLGALATPRQSLTYWTSTVLQSDRPGILSYAGNQSFVGALARLGVNGTARSVCWALLCVVALVACVLGMRRALAVGAAAWALGLNALFGLLASPVSWTHHWVWLAPILVVLPLASTGAVWVVAWLVIVALILIGPQWLFPHGGVAELGWSPWQQLLGDGYVLWAVAVLGLAAVGRLGPRRDVPLGLRAGATPPSSPRRRSAA